MTRKLMGKKSGMTQVFDDNGHAIAVTVVQAEPNVITQIKTKEADGYNAIQFSFERIAANDPRRQEARCKKPQRGHFAKANVTPRRHSAECRVDNAESFKVGDEFGVGIFAVGTFVDVTGTSKGKGYQGVIKKYNFSGGPAAHGSGFHRHAGSTGMRSTPGHCLKGGPRPSQMGNKQVTVQDVQVIDVNEELGVIYLKGSIPGAQNGLVFLSPATKKQQAAEA